jgi:hypothetical protein
MIDTKDLLDFEIYPSLCKVRDEKFLIQIGQPRGRRAFSPL